MVKKLFLIVLTLTLASCASYMKRKACESTNWFEHGKKVALSGKWLNSDEHLMECRKVEASISETQVDQGFKNGLQIYCSPDEAYKVGKSGDPYSNDLCEGPQSTVLRQRHAKGILDYCAKGNGYNAGISGKKYQNVCPANLETAFLIEYKKGRKKFVSTSIEIHNQDLRRLSADLNTQRMRTSMAQMNLSRAESRLSSLRSQSLNNTSEDQKMFVNNMMTEAESDANSLRSQYQSALSAEHEVQNKVKSLEATVSNLKLELASLD